MTPYDADMICVGLMGVVLTIETVLCIINATRNGR